MWHGVADALAARFEVVAIDLRCYRDSSRPAPDPEHLAHSKRCMAADALDIAPTLATYEGSTEAFARACAYWHWFAGRRLGMPVRVLWGRHGAIESCFDAISLWRERADDVSGRAVDCGHCIAEERPAERLAEMLAFFVA